jgi:oligogalacturonide lyase
MTVSPHRAIPSALKSGGALAAALFLAIASPARLLGDEPPVEWIDHDTGHRVVRLSTEPNTSSMYFNVASYTPDGKKLIVSDPHGISLINLDTRKIEPLIEGRAGIVGIGRKSGVIYYVRHTDAGSVLFGTSSVDFKTRKIADLHGSEGVASINADETLIAGTTADFKGRIRHDGTLDEKVAVPAAGAPKLTHAQEKDLMLHRRLMAKIPMTIFTINLATGERRTLVSSTDWLNHLEFSPTDPKTLLFCHEGVWQEVDRLWTVQTDGSALTQVHHRAMAMEIAGHEFWSADGKTIWYDLQTPRGEDFWVAGYDLASGSRIQYHLERNEWSVHYNVSPDGSLFAGDGGDSEMVAHAPDGKWIYLFRPEKLPIGGGVEGVDPKTMISPGVFHAERMVNMAKHNYLLEPNVSFSPDMRWLIFRSNMFGPTHVFAVEIKRSSNP